MNAGFLLGSLETEVLHTPHRFQMFFILLSYSISLSRFSSTLNILLMSDQMYLKCLYKLSLL